MVRDLLLWFAHPQLSGGKQQTALTNATRYHLAWRLGICVFLPENKCAKKEVEPKILFAEYEIEADEDLFMQARLNLIDNAARFSGPVYAFRGGVSQDAAEDGSAA